MKTAFLELIRKTACTLPSDVAAALRDARDREDEGAPARSALTEVLGNLNAASCSSRPLCQDTGTNLWYVYLPPSMDKARVAKEILAATREAVQKAYLRPNAVDSITGKNSGDNTGEGQPLIHFCEWKKKHLAADLLLKGGGCENVSCQFSLPYRWQETGVEAGRETKCEAGRDLEGVRKVVIEGVFQAQGRGCAPGILGVCIGGDRASSMVAAKEQLFRPLTDENPNPALAELEQRLIDECNELFIGPMGFGGRTTLLGVKIGALHRLPASFFVSISYICWAARRMSVEIKNTGFRVLERCVTAEHARMGRMP